MKGFCGLLLLSALLFGIAYSLDCYACSEANLAKCTETIKCASDEIFCMTNYTASESSNSKGVLHRSINKASTNSTAKRSHHLQQHSTSKRGHHLQRSHNKRGDRTKEAPPRALLPIRLWKFSRRSVNKADANSPAEMSHNLQERSPKKSGDHPKPGSPKKTGHHPKADSPAKRSHNLQEHSTLKIAPRAVKIEGTNSTVKFVPRAANKEGSSSGKKTGSPKGKSKMKKPHGSKTKSNMKSKSKSNMKAHHGSKIDVKRPKHPQISSDENTSNTPNSNMDRPATTVASVDQANSHVTHHDAQTSNHHTAKTTPKIAQRAIKEASSSTSVVATARCVKTCTAQYGPVVYTLCCTTSLCNKPSKLSIK